VIAIGPTTSSRMNPFEPEFIEKFSVSAIIGKGGMDDRVIDAMRNRTVYLAMTGGCAATAASKIKIIMRCLIWPLLRGRKLVIIMVL